MLDEQDLIVIKLLASNNDNSSFFTELLGRIGDVTCISREKTGVGFYAHLQINPPLDELPIPTLYDCNFEHVDIEYGGYLMCRIHSECNIELEGVTYVSPWPDSIDDNLLEYIPIGV